MAYLCSNCKEYINRNILALWVIDVLFSMQSEQNICATLFLYVKNCSFSLDLHLWHRFCSRCLLVRSIIQCFNHSPEIIVKTNIRVTCMLSLTLFVVEYLRTIIRCFGLHRLFLNVNIYKYNKYKQKGRYILKWIDTY